MILSRYRLSSEILGVCSVSKEIDQFCFNLVKENISSSEEQEEFNRNYGTLAKDKQKKNLRMFGFTKLNEITKISIKGLINIFVWVVWLH